LIVVTFRCPRRGKHYLYDSTDKSIGPKYLNSINRRGKTTAAAAAAAAVIAARGAF